MIVVENSDLVRLQSVEPQSIHATIHCNVKAVAYREHPTQSLYAELFVHFSQLSYDYVHVSVQVNVECYFKDQA